MANNEINTNEVCDILNEIMEYELAGVVRYTHSSMMVSGPYRLPIVTFLKEQAAESLMHAQLAGEKIASTSGLAFAAQVDPNTGSSTPVISQILMLFLLVVFLAIDVHLIVIRTMLDSYEYIKIDSMPTLDILLKTGIGAAGSMFLAATIIMLPVSVLLLMVNVSIGVMTRSAPTLNLFSFGFPITLLGTFIFLYFSASSIGFAMSDLVEAAIRSMQDMIWGINYG